MTKTGNFLVTGASGFLGSAVAKALSEEQVDFYAMQHRRAVDPLPGMTVLQGGTRTLDAALLDCYDIDAVIHCARPTAPRFRQFGRRWAAWRAARDNAFLVREVTGSGQQRRLVFASGSLVYGSSSTPHGEDAPVRPLSYAREYHAGEIPLEQAVRAGKAVMILRFPWILGNGSWFRWFYLEPLKRTGKVPLFGNGTNLMTIAGVDDAARFMVSCLHSDLTNGFVNVAAPHVVSQIDFANLVAAHYGGTVADYREIFRQGVEKSVLEAFTSNILLRSDHTSMLSNHTFSSPYEVLKTIPHA